MISATNGLAKRGIALRSSAVEAGRKGITHAYKSNEQVQGALRPAKMSLAADQYCARALNTGANEEEKIILQLYCFLTIEETGYTVVNHELGG